MPAECAAEIEALDRTLGRDPVPAFLLDAADYELDACRTLMGEVRRRLDDGPGVVVVDRVPVETLSDRPRIEEVFWLLGAMVGAPGRPDPGRRGDGGGHRYRGRETDRGTGLSHQRRPAAPRRQLLQPHAARPREPALPPGRPGGRGEPLRQLLLRPQRPARGASGAAGTPLPPVLPGPPGATSGRTSRRRCSSRCSSSGRGGDLRCRYTHFTIPAGYETAGVEMDEETRLAFETMTRVVEDPALCCEFTLEPGRAPVREQPVVRPRAGVVHRRPGPRAKAPHAEALAPRGRRTPLPRLIRAGTPVHRAPGRIDRRLPRGRPPPAPPVGPCRSRLQSRSPDSRDPRCAASIAR